MFARSHDSPLETRVGDLCLKNPVMLASGTAGYGSEFTSFFDVSELGAVVVKSLATFPWEGNAAPRVNQTPAGMINSVVLLGA